MTIHKNCKPNALLCFEKLQFRTYLSQKMHLFTKCNSVSIKKKKCTLIYNKFTECLEDTFMTIEIRDLT